jgi:hypothetical protein
MKEKDIERELAIKVAAYGISSLSNVELSCVLDWICKYRTHNVVDFVPKKNKRNSIESESEFFH